MPINRQWVLRQRPQGLIKDGDLELVESPTPNLKDGDILVRTIYLSLDPTNRTWMNDAVGYLPPVGLGEVMRGLTLGVVEETRSQKYKVGDLVTTAMGGWADYGVVPDSGASRVHRAPGLPLTANMSVMGMTGMTAYFGVTDVLKPEPGQVMVISAAAGAVGSIAGQIAKQRGAHVIGIAGGPDKCRWLVEDLGFDAAIDYKNEDVGEALDRLAPNGVDLNFENVGGDIMVTVWNRLNLHARMAVCGMVSAYNATKRPPSPDLSRLITHRMTMQGFLVMDYAPRAKEMVAELGPWLAEGKVKWKVHVDNGLEGALTSLNRLFTGDHDGKLLVRVSEEPAIEDPTMSESLHLHFEDLENGQVLQLGALAVDEAAVEAFVERFAPGWDTAYGAPDAMVYALWSRLAAEKAAGWAQTKVLAVDGLRFMRNPPPGELLRGRMTVMGKDPVGDEKGIVIAQHDLLDEGGRLVFGCLTRALFVRR